jgi:hypothetical protein
VYFKTVQQYEVEAVWASGCLIHPSRGAAKRVWQKRHNTKLSGGWSTCLCHTCDTPACILDAHHFIGTQADNVHDAVNKGHHRCLRKQSEAERLKRSATLRVAHRDHPESWAACNGPDQCAAVSKAAKKLWADPVRRAALMKARYTLEKRKNLSDRAKKQRKVAGKFV